MLVFPKRDNTLELSVDIFEGTDPWSCPRLLESEWLGCSLGQKTTVLRDFGAMFKSHF